MRSLHLTLMIFGQVLLAAFIFYSAIATASPLSSQPVVASSAQKQAIEAPKGQVHVAEQVKHVAQVSHAAVHHQAAAPAKVDSQMMSARSAVPVAEPVPKVVEHAVPVVHKVEPMASPAAQVVPAHVEPAKLEAKMAKIEKVQPDAPSSVPVQAQMTRSRLLPESVVKHEEAQVEAKSAAVPQKVSMDGKSVVKNEAQKESNEVKVSPSKVYESMKGKSEAPIPVPVVPVQQVVVSKPEVHQAVPVEQVKSFEGVGVAEKVNKVEPVSASAFLVVQSPEPKITVVSRVEAQQAQQAPQVQQVPEQQVPIQVVQQVAAPTVTVVKSAPDALVASPAIKSPSSPVVNGGLGPLHLLANTLCSYSPDKPVADETLNALYNQRASVRKSLFDFMSLKFTALEKLSSRLNPGLEVMPTRKTTDPGVVPSHGWPVVGKCTAHDLKLMAEAAWCETSTPAVPSTEALDKETPKITSNHHRSQSARLLDETPDQSAVISKILHVSDIKDAPIVESTIANLNLTQQQLVDIQAQATSTRMCRRNALKMTKALLNHLAEEQKNVSDSWPQLYSAMASDDCARKRMIDIVNALAMFRTDSTSIRRDNVEFAFAMDDLRSKVLDSEVNVPLTFDKQFIEVEQFLQQSVKLMLSNIDPERAKLTSMRYRSLMPGPLSADDQCIELHQRLLAKNYPTDCNPTQFGQLPDVLRMAASSLELWSIEKELGKRSFKVQEYPTGSQAVRQDVNDCIANLVAS